MGTLFGFLIGLLFAFFVLAIAAAIGQMSRRLKAIEELPDAADDDEVATSDGSLVFESEEDFEAWLTEMITKVVASEIRKQ